MQEFTRNTWHICIFCVFHLAIPLNLNNFAANFKIVSNKPNNYGRKIGSEGAGPGCCPLLG
jgi:hypothetical protein